MHYLVKLDIYASDLELFCAKANFVSEQKNRSSAKRVVAVGIHSYATLSHAQLIQRSTSTSEFVDIDTKLELLEGSRKWDLSQTTITVPRQGT